MNESASKGPVGNVTARTPSTRPTLAPSIPTIQPPAAQPRSVPTLPATRFFPEPGVNTGQVVPANPSRLALHQAHLRTPKLVAQQLLIQPPAAKERAYRYFHSFALEPRRFASNERVLTWKFDVSEQDAARRPLRTQPTAPHEYSLLTVELDTRIFRLRCVQGSLPTETEWRSWPTKSTYWPSDVFFECNGELLEERRKLGHGKDLPIDVTQFVRAGSNEVRMVSNMDSKAPVTGFSVAVEIVVVEMYNKIKQDCMQRRMPREQTLTAIAAGMQSEDDDLRLTFATIGLRDPMLGSRIWDIPMRGPDCRHREVWDLETFLNSRGRRPDDEVSMTDVWRCPICKEDARPNVIMVDEWMLDVRRDLENSGQLNVRSIRVEANGSWTVVEEKGDEPSASRTMSKQSEGIKNPDGTSLTPKVGVIELDGEDV